MKGCTGMLDGEQNLPYCFVPRFWVLLGLKTYQENNVNGIYQLFLNYFNVTISNLATTS